VKNVDVRLDTSDRDTLQSARINPIATFPKLGFVIYGQKTLQLANSALNRVNVRRMLLEVKRIVINTAQNMVFDQNTAATRNTFVAKVNTQLSLIKSASGINSFRVIMDSSNNSQADADANRVNGSIIVVPTRTFEFIDMSFIITNSGVTFV